MGKLVIPGFVDLKYYVPLCASYMFVTPRRRQCRTRGKKSGYISKYTDNNPGAGVSVDQLQSDNPGLVLQFLSKLTSARIWDAQVMLELFYMHLMRSTIQEETLVVKADFKDGLPNFEIKLKCIIHTMEDFLNILSDHQLMIPTRLYHSTVLNIIIKIPLLKEKYKLSH